MYHKLLDIWTKHKEIWLYLIFGGLTTIVSIASFALFQTILGMNELVANVISWILSVLFAFATNRVWVFEAQTKGAKAFFAQMGKFFGGRLSTLAVEEAILAVFVTWLGGNALVVKVIAQIIVIVLNYVLSKLWIFKKVSSKNE